MIRFVFVSFIIFILILFCRKLMRIFEIAQLKKEIKANPFIGIEQEDKSYNYTRRGYTIGYKVERTPAGLKPVKWLYLKRRITFLEKKLLNIKEDLDKIFVYQKWFSLFRPSGIIILIILLIGFYLLVEGDFLRRQEYFRWIAAQITGLRPESIRYAGEGLFKVSGKRRFLDKEADPVTISFNPLGWLFSPNTINVNRWNQKLNRYVTYSVTIGNEGDIWLGKKVGNIQSKLPGMINSKMRKQIHGKMQADNIIWDELAGSHEVSGHQIAVEDGKLRFIDK